MIARALTRTGLAALVLAVVPFGRTASAQGPERVPPTCIRDVGLPTVDAPDRRVTLVLRDGRVEAVLPHDAPAPPGTRIVDGAGLVALPAFLDAYSRNGVATPEPVKDQDLPLDEASDVRIDMRLANRKGIQPAFRAVDALALGPDATERWREAGFGAALVAPSGELLAGTSALATTRAAAPRDQVLAAEVWAHGAFRASGDGYPSTLMGYIAQLRQFFLDARWQDELERRFQEGRPGARPPFDADLRAARALLRGERVLACEAESARDIERWLKLADQFGLRVAVVGGNDAARVADVLATRDVPVVLTLDWGREVEDPLAKEKKKAGPKKEAQEEAAPDAAAEEAAPPEGTDLVDPSPGAVAVEAEPAEGPAEQESPAVESETDAEAEDEDGDEPDWIYEEPLPVRLEQRRLWEERRDVALRLSEAGVRFAFGSDGDAPKDLLGKVRDLVEVGLPREVALAALTTEPARLFGVDRRVGRLAPGYDATLTLWTADPLADDDAQVAWLFVDGHGTEYEVEPPDPDAEGEPVDAAGTWTLSIETMGEVRESTLVLEQGDDGELSGTLTYSSPDGEEQTTDVSGEVRGSTLELEGALTFGDSAGSLSLDAKVDGDALEGTATYRFPFAEEPFEAPVSGTRTPEVLLELERHTESCHEDHAHGGSIR